jgi:hypothetical protein
MERCQIARCRRELAAIEAEILAGNPGLIGLCLAMRDWSAELRILENEQRRRDALRRREGGNAGELQGLME